MGLAGLLSAEFLKLVAFFASASILIALINISFQTIRAAVVNPVRSLRLE
jgi:hypothetical protein